MYWLNGLNTAHRLCQGLELWHCAMPGMAFGRSSPDLAGRNRSAVSASTVSHWTSEISPPGVSAGLALRNASGVTMPMTGTSSLRPASCTIAATIRMVDASARSLVNNQTGSTITGFLAHVTSGAVPALLGSTTGSSWNIYTLGTSIGLNSWARIVWTYDAATGRARLYRNGRFDVGQTLASPAPLVWEVNDWSVYGSGLTSGLFTSYAHDIKVYSRPFGDADAWAEYVESLTGNRNLFTPSSAARRTIAVVATTFTATIAGTMGAMSASLAAGFTKPTYTASIAGTHAPMTAALGATRTLPTFAASIAASHAAMSAILSAGFTKPTYTATISATHAPMSAALSATFATVQFSASIATTLGAMSASLAATFLKPTLTASIAATNAPMSAAVSATFDEPAYTASIAGTLGAMTSTVSATSATEIDTASIVATMGAMTASLTAVYSDIVYVTTDCGIVPHFTRSTVPRFRRRNIIASIRRNTVPRFRRARR